MANGNGEGITPMVERSVNVEIMDDVEIGAPNSTGLGIDEAMVEIEITESDDGGAIVDFDPQEENEFADDDGV